MNLSAPSPARVAPSIEPPGCRLAVAEPLHLDSGIALGPYTIAYQTYGPAQ